MIYQYLENTHLVFFLSHINSLRFHVSILAKKQEHNHRNMVNCKGPFETYNYHRNMVNCEGPFETYNYHRNMVNCKGPCTIITETW